MRRITKTERALRMAVYHAALASGSFLFAIPFIWLLSTSCKVSDEMYPPRWIPQIPSGIIESPYIGIRENERPLRPVGVTESDWTRVYPPILDALTARVLALQDELPAFFTPYLEAPELAESLLNRLAKRAPDELFTQSEASVAAWFADRADPPLILSVLDTVYRRMAMSYVELHCKDIATVERPAVGKENPWTVLDGDVQLVPRDDDALHKAQEVHYSFARQNTFRLGISLPMSMPPERLRKLVVSLHADRSWQAIHAVVEMAGRRYEAAQPAFLESDRWQEVTWQFASEQDQSIQTRNWIRLDDAGSSEYSAANQVRITLECRHAPRMVAGINKYLNNYRNVFRQVPLFSYVKNSLFLVVLNVAGQIIGSSLVAYSFARLKWPARDFCFLLVLATLMIPPQVTMIPVFLIFKSIGWYNSLKPLWVPAFFGSAFFIFLLRQFMRSIPLDLEDSAKIDGCSYFGIYCRIILPLVKPALATIGIFTFQGAWNDFMGPLVYVSDQELYPLSLGLFALQTTRFGDYALMMAASVLMTLPIILLFFLAQRQFIQGITLTGLKG